MIFVRDETRVYGLLMLLANVGEFPMHSLEILGSRQSWTKLIYDLQQTQDFCISATGDVKRFQMLTVSGKGRNPYFDGAFSGFDGYHVCGSGL